MKTQPEQPHTIRLSVWWILLALAMVFLLGFAGSTVGSYVLQPSLPSLTSEGQEFITNVQQVTISPSKNIRSLIEKNERSIVVLAGRQGDAIETRAIGIVVTNDGVILSPFDAPDTSLVALDSTGQVLPLQKIGVDPLYGLSYFRASNTTLTPFEVAADDAAIGVKLLLLSRSGSTLHSQAAEYTLYEYVLPPDNTPLGIQRLARVVEPTANAAVGTTLIDEEGRLTGIMTQPDDGLFIPASEIRRSLDRLAANRREHDPFEAIGLDVTYAFRNISADDNYQFIARIQQVTPNTPAARAALRPGELITAVNEEKLTWTIHFEEKLAQPLPLKLTVLDSRGEERVVTLTEEVPDASS